MYMLRGTTLGQTGTTSLKLYILFVRGLVIPGGKREIRGIGGRRLPGLVGKNRSVSHGLFSMGEACVIMKQFWSQVYSGGHR
jgi:hypothetical protein